MKYLKFSELKEDDIIYSVTASVGNCVYNYGESDEVKKYEVRYLIKEYYFKGIKKNMPFSPWMLHVKPVKDGEWEITGTTSNVNLSKQSSTLIRRDWDKGWANHEFFTTKEEAKNFIKKMINADLKKYQDRIKYIGRKLEKVDEL